MNVITYPCWDLSEIILAKETPRVNTYDADETIKWILKHVSKIDLIAQKSVSRD